MPGVARQEDRRAGVVLRHGRLVRVAKFFQLARIVRLDPTRRMKRGALEFHRHVVLRADTIGQDLELQRSDDADDPVGIHARLEDARRALFGDLLERACEYIVTVKPYRYCGLKFIFTDTVSIPVPYYRKGTV